jgi:polyhydroxyalkanoate depolymerase
VLDSSRTKKVLRMMYSNYQMIANAMEPLRWWAQQMPSVMQFFGVDPDLPLSRQLNAAYEQAVLSGLTHSRPPFAIAPVQESTGQAVKVTETEVTGSAFCKLVRFRKANARDLPKVLLVAPMSGHFATLLRGTVQVLVQDHDVYLTDWVNVRDVPLSDGVFDLDAYIGEIIGFMQWLGPGAHLMGVCQPTVACLAAASVMAEDNDACVPLSLTLMAGPIDTRINPTVVNKLATTKPIEWFEQNLIAHVPMQFAGAGRKVYPGFVQLMAFMGMNQQRHNDSFQQLYALRRDGENDKANAIKTFYEEYFAVMDLSAPFYLETVAQVFQEYRLPQGLLRYRGRSVNPQALRKTFLLTVEGERDDICGIGQTLAAHELCSRIPAYMKTHHLQAGVGHYGVFSGKRWAHQIYPVVRSMVQYAQPRGAALRVA